MACGGCSKKKTDFSKKLEEAKRMQPQDKNKPKPQPTPPFQKAFLKTKEIAKESQKNTPPNRLATKSSQVDLDIHNYRVKKTAEKIKRRQELIKSYQEYIKSNRTNPTNPTNPSNPPDSSQK